MKVRTRKKQIAAKALQHLCKHEYDTPCFMVNCLYFCKHCDRELLGRTFDDIEPLTDEERERLEQLDVIYNP